MWVREFQGLSNSFSFEEEKKCERPGKFQSSYFSEQRLQRMEKVKTNGIRRLRTGGGVDDKRKDEMKSLLRVFCCCR